jgi:dihydrofolate synthase / folylpolyglutamate synthase
VKHDVDNDPDSPHPPAPSPTRGEGEHDAAPGAKSPSPLVGEGLGWGSDALEWLFGFTNSEAKLPRTPQEFNLPRVEALLELLGNPHTRYPAVLIAGTKGKGSTAALSEAILRAVGLRVGLYTSPHFHTLRERVQIDRQLISAGAVVEQVEQIRADVARMPPALGALSTYEVTTALALRYFAAQQVDLALLEIGLGGRYDAVNLVTPLVSAISSISYDHTQTLGQTLGAIAYQKAGIIKPGVPVVTVPQAPEAAQVIAAVAHDQSAPLFIAEPEGLRDTISGALRPYPAPIQAETVGLRGDFQLTNARLASGIVCLLSDQGLPVPDDAFAKGLAAVAWPGRIETLRERPLIIADGAHNGDSARQLIGALHQLFTYQRLHLILAVSADKDLAAITAALVPAAHTIWLTQTRHPRAAPVEQLWAAAVPLASGELRTATDVAEALAEALAVAQADDLICVTGSLFAVAVAHEACGVAEAEGW